jgi:flagellar hook-basal body complex protein FliE
MPTSINGLGFPMPPVPPASEGVAAPSGTDRPLFQNLLLDSLNQVESIQQSAQAAVAKGLTGDDVTQIEVLTSVKKADLALRMMIQIRNKIFDAYDEIKQLRM